MTAKRRRRNDVVTLLWHQCFYVNAQRKNSLIIGLPSLQDGVIHIGRNGDTVIVARDFNLVFAENAIGVVLVLLKDLAGYYYADLVARLGVDDLRGIL